MAKKTERLKYLLKQYAENCCTHAELLELLQLIEASDDDDIKQALPAIEANSLPEAELPSEAERELIFDQIVGSNQTRSIGIKRWLSIAATVFITVGVAYWFVAGRKKINADNTTNIASTVQEVRPGSNKAILTLSSGKTIVLSPKHNGMLVAQTNANVNQVDSSAIVYQAKASAQGAAEYNTVATPRGGQFKVILSDGTQVWLNAASSIKYPTVFSGNERVVEITGEAYFEVAHNPSKPFRVHIIKANHLPGGTVEVLGTHFNINAYDDEGSVKTTLLEGRVRVQQNNLTAILQPGEQSTLDNQGQNLIVKKVNTEPEVAWKNGYFQFEHADIKQVMRQVARWYDVQITYEGNGQNADKFGGTIMRDMPLNQLLHTLEISMVHFKLDGRKVIVFY